MSRPRMLTVALLVLAAAMAFGAIRIIGGDRALLAHVEQR
jgi:hypothetical protein